MGSSPLLNPAHHRGNGQPRDEVMSPNYFNRQVHRTPEKQLSRDAGSRKKDFYCVLESCECQLTIWLWSWSLKIINTQHQTVWEEEARPADTTTANKLHQKVVESCMWCLDLSESVKKEKKKTTHKTLQLNIRLEDQHITTQHLRFVVDEKTFLQEKAVYFVFCGSSLFVSCIISAVSQTRSATT